MREKLHLDAVADLQSRQQGDTGIRDDRIERHAERPDRGGRDGHRFEVGEITGDRRTLESRAFAGGGCRRE
jgi:hypothetical protein